MRTLLLATLLMMTSAPAALAACPPLAVGSAAEAVAANSARLLCLQAELAQATRERQFEVELQALQRATQSLTLQRRFDALPRPGVPYFP